MKGDIDKNEAMNAPWHDHALRWACVFSLVCLLAPFHAVADGVVRNFTFVSAQSANVDVTWDFAEVPESAVIVKESISDGWRLVFSSDENPSVEAVRQDGTTWSFLVQRSELQSAGGFRYSLVRDGGAGAVSAADVVSGYFFSSGLDGIDVAGVARGLENELQMASEEAEGNRVFRITGFDVKPGDHPRVTISWMGSGSSPVAIQWKPALGFSGKTVDSRARSADGWTTLQVVTPSSERRVPRDASRSAADDETFTVTPDVDAPEGFYRIVISSEASE